MKIGVTAILGKSYLKESIMMKSRRSTRTRLWPRSFPS